MSDGRNDGPGPETAAGSAARRAPRGWIALCHAAAVPKPGDVRPFDPWNVPLLAVRDGEGRISVFRNVCSHRGRRLVARASHLFGMKIRCPSHQWVYALDGSLLSAPRYAPPRSGGAEGNDWREYGLKPVPGTVWAGIVFVNLGAPRSCFDARLPARVRARIEGDEQFATHASCALVERVLGADVTAAMKSLRVRLHVPGEAGDTRSVWQAQAGSNALWGRAPGLCYSVVVEPRRRAGCVLHVRYRLLAEDPSAPSAWRWGRILARLCKTLAGPREVVAQPPSGSGVETR